MHLRKVLKRHETEYPESSLLKGVRLSLAASTSPGLEHVFNLDHQVTEKY